MASLLVDCMRLVWIPPHNYVDTSFLCMQVEDGPDWPLCQAERLGVEPADLAHLPMSPDLAIFHLLSADLAPAIKYSTQLMKLC